MASALVACGAVAIFAIASTAPAAAQTFEQVGIRAQGMGGAFVAVADDATASWWNPAGLANAGFVNTILEWDARADPFTTSAHAFAIGYPALGLSYYRVNAGVTTAVSGSAPVSSRTVSQFGLTFGQSLSDHLVVASTVKLLHADAGTNLDLDLGAMAAAGPLRVGVVIKNLVRPEFSDAGETFELPRQVRAGASFNVGTAGRPDVVFAVDADLTKTPTPLGDSRVVTGGVEGWMLARRVGLRAGAGISTVDDARKFVSFGTSLALRAGLYADFQATRGQDDIRSGWGLGLRVTF